MSSYTKTPTIFQMEATECGAASLSMVFAYFGKNIPLEQMRIETGVSRDGCNAGNIMRCAKKYGLECHGYRKELDGLKNVQTPCIIHWNFNHFVVFEGFKGKYAYINDPAVGRRKLSIEELDDAFTGVVLTFKPTSDFKKEKKKNTLIKFIGNRIEGQYGLIAKLLFVGILLVFPGLILPVLSQIFMDDILIGGNTGWFEKLILFMVGTIFLQVILNIYRDAVLVRFKKKLVLISARDFLNNLFKLPISFFDQRYVGDLTGRVNNNAKVSDFLAGELAETILNILITIFYMILLMIYSPILTGIALISVMANLIAMKVTANLIANASIKLQQDAGKLSGAVCAGISIMPTLKASGSENEYVSRVHGYNAKTISLEQKLNRSQNIINAIPKSF